MKKFQVGDRVKVFTPKMTMVDGHMGTVVEDRGLWYDVRLDNDSLIGLFERDLIAWPNA